MQTRVRHSRIGHQLEVGVRLRVPAAAAEQHERALRLREHRAQPVEIGCAGMCRDTLIARGVGGRRGGDLHVFRQCEHHGAGTP